MKRLLWLSLAGLCVFLPPGCDANGPASQESAQAPQRSIQGSVRLPDFENLESLGRGAVFRERAARDVPVDIRHVGETDGTLAQTRTDVDGDWSVSVPAQTPLDGSIVAEASVEDVTLRRGIVTEFGNAITVRSEALGRMLEERSTSAATLPRATYLNVLSMLATAADLTNPVDWSGDETIEASIQRVRRAGNADERLHKRLKSLTPPPSR